LALYSTLAVSARLSITSMGMHLVYRDGIPARRLALPIQGQIPTKYAFLVPRPEPGNEI